MGVKKAEENDVYCCAFFICNYVAFILATWTKIPVKLYMLWPIAIFSIVAFLYDPFMQARFYGGDGVDLCRHFDSLDSIRLGFDDGLYIEAPLSALYLRMVAYLFDDNSFLPLISTWIYYGLAFFICNKFFALLKLSAPLRRFAICMILMCGVFFGNMNNIRYPLATVIFFAGMYFDIIASKAKRNLLYICAFLMHPGTIILFLVRCIANVKLKYSIIIFAILSLFVANYYETLIITLISILTPFPDIQMTVSAVLLKSVSYSTNDVYDVPLLFKVLNIYISCVLMVSALFNMYYSRCNTIFKYIQRMALVVVLLSFIGTITNFMDGNFADRLMSIVPFLIALLVSDTLMGMERKNKNYMYIKSIFFLLALPYIGVYLFKVYPNWIYLGL